MTNKRVPFQGLGAGFRLFVIAGERSGDLHGSNLIKAIKNADNQAVIHAWGGDYMAKSGAIITKHYRELAFMGFVEVLKNLPKIIGFIGQCKNEIEAFQPDAIILIDYAGFNMRIAKWAKSKGIKVFYYIAPKVWAWNQDRAIKLKAMVDRLFVIFPFEVEFFKKYDFEVEYVGNPLNDAIEQFEMNPSFKENNQISGSKIIALLPGSRRQEVIQMLDLMVSTKSQFPDYQYIIAGVSNLPRELYEPYLTENVSLIIDQTYDLLKVAEAALVTSGTATLETALFEVPQVVCYRANWISYQIGKRLIRVPFISLVNLIAQKEVVKELIQNELNTENLTKELKQITENKTNRNHQIEAYKSIKKALGNSGASERVGKRIVKILNNA